MSPVDRKQRNTGNSTPSALIVIARLFKLHLRLAREMYRDGYLQIIQKIPEYPVCKNSHRSEKSDILNICVYYEISSDKIMLIYNKGYINLDGFDYAKEISRYMQRKDGKLSIRLLSYLAYDSMRSGGCVVKDQKAHDCLSALKIGGKLNPPKDLEPYLNLACRGQTEALERVARWMRDLIESVGEPREWVFYGVRLALAEGQWGVYGRPVPRLRRLKRLRKLARLLRNHPLLRGCVTPVAKSGSNSGYVHVFHSPGVFWDL